MCFYFLGCFQTHPSAVPLSINPHLTKRRRKHQGRLYLSETSSISRCCREQTSRPEPSLAVPRPSRQPEAKVAPAALLPPRQALHQCCCSGRSRRTLSDPSSGGFRQAPPKPQPVIYKAQTLTQTRVHRRFALSIKEGTLKQSCWAKKITSP